MNYQFLSKCKVDIQIDMSPLEWSSSVLEKRNLKSKFVTLLCFVSIRKPEWMSPGKSPTQERKTSTHLGAKSSPKCLSCAKNLAKTSHVLSH